MIRYNEGSRWFRRIQEDCAKISKHIRFKKIKNGFFRVYFKNAYLHECYKEMPMLGYDIYDLNPRMESKKYYQEYEDYDELPRKLKNYVEGYYDAIDRIRKRIFLSRTQKEFHDNATKAYKQFRIK